MATAVGESDTYLGRQAKGNVGPFSAHLPGEVGASCVAGRTRDLVFCRNSATGAISRFEAICRQAEFVDLRIRRGASAMVSTVSARQADGTSFRATPGKEAPFHYDVGLAHPLSDDLPKWPKLQDLGLARRCPPYEACSRYGHPPLRSCSENGGLWLPNGRPHRATLE